MGLNFFNFEFKMKSCNFPCILIRTWTLKFEIEDGNAKEPSFCAHATYFGTEYSYTRRYYVQFVKFWKTQNFYFDDVRDKFSTDKYRAMILERNFVNKLFFRDQSCTHKLKKIILNHTIGLSRPGWFGYQFSNFYILHTKLSQTRSKLKLKHNSSKLLTLTNKRMLAVWLKTKKSKRPSNKFPFSLQISEKYPFFDKLSCRKLTIITNTHTPLQHVNTQ